MSLNTTTTIVGCVHSVYACSQFDSEFDDVDDVYNIKYSIFINFDGKPILSNTLIKALEDGIYVLTNTTNTTNTTNITDLLEINCISVVFIKHCFLILVDDGSLISIKFSKFSTYPQKIEDMVDVKYINGDFIVTNTNNVYNLISNSDSPPYQFILNLLIKNSKPITKIKVYSYEIIFYYDDLSIEVFELMDGHTNLRYCSKTMKFLLDNISNSNVIDFLLASYGNVIMYGDGTIKLSKNYTILKETEDYMHVIFNTNSVSPNRHPKFIITILKNKGLFVNVVDMYDFNKYDKTIDSMYLHYNLFKAECYVPQAILYITTQNGQCMYVFIDGSFKIFDMSCRDSVLNIYPNPIETYKLKLENSGSYI